MEPVFDRLTAWGKRNFEEPYGGFGAHTFIERTRYLF